MVERIRMEEASARLAKAAEVGRILQVSKQLRESVIDLSENVARAKQARDAVQLAEAAKSRAELVEQAKREGLAALRSFQTERQKTLDRAKGTSGSKDLGRDKGRGLELTKTEPPKGPRAGGDLS